jgi:hypothetical protein
VCVCVCVCARALMYACVKLPLFLMFVHNVDIVTWNSYAHVLSADFVILVGGYLIAGSC